MAAAINNWFSQHVKVIKVEGDEVAESIPTAEVEAAEDDDTALLRYLQNQGKLSQDKANGVNVNNNKTNNNASLPSGAAEDKEQDVNEKDASAKKSEGGGDNKKMEEDEAQRKKKEEEDEKNSLLKYMSQRGVVLRPPVAQAVAVPVGDTLDGSTKKVEGRFSLGVDGVDQVPTADLLREALEELNEASFPLKYVLGEENGRNLREEICADPKKFLRDHRAGIRLIARAANRFFELEAKLKQEGIDKKLREQELKAARERTRKLDLKREKAWMKRDAAISKGKGKEGAGGVGSSGGGGGGDGSSGGGGGWGGSSGGGGDRRNGGIGKGGVTGSSGGGRVGGGGGVRRSKSKESESESSSEEEGPGLAAISQFVGGS